MNKVYGIIFREPVYTEIKDIHYWYELQTKGLGDKFIEFLNETFELIKRNPLLYIKVYQRFRKAKTKTFPYLIIFEIKRNDILIYHVIHEKRHPKLRFKR